jgi:hypothetical protein
VRRYRSSTRPSAASFSGSRIVSAPCTTRKFVGPTLHRNGTCASIWPTCPQPDVSRGESRPRGFKTEVANF